MAAGFVYILRNPYFIGNSGAALLKIGGTARSAQLRALELSAATGVPGRFSVVYHAATPDWQRLEVAVHRALKAHRRAGEFFEVAPDAAIAVIETLLQQTRAAPQSNRDPGEASTYETRVAFKPKPFGYEVQVEGIAFGTLIVAEGALRYVLFSEISREPILEAELALRPNPAGSQAMIGDAKNRAAWLALLLKRFTTPDFGGPDGAGTRLVSVNGLAIARLTQHRRRAGLLNRQETVSHDLAPLPSRAPRLAECFGATVTITPTYSPPHPERIFVAFAGVTLETSVRHYLLDQTLADARFSHERWTCHLTLLNCEVKLVRRPHRDT